MQATASKSKNSKPSAGSRKSLITFAVSGTAAKKIEAIAKSEERSVSSVVRRIVERALTQVV